MTDKPQEQYLKAKIMTAGPEQLQLMLYDGAIRFCEQARQAMQVNDIPTTHDRLLRAERIVLELSNGLRAEVNRERAAKLTSLYNYVYRLLVDANFSKNIEALTEAMGLLSYQRNTWQMVLEKLRQERSPGPAGAGAGGPAGRRPIRPDPAPAQPVKPSKPSGIGAPLIGGRICLEG